MCTNDFIGMMFTVDFMETVDLIHGGWGYSHLYQSSAALIIKFVNIGPIFYKTIPRRVTSIVSRRGQTLISSLKRRCRPSFPSSSLSLSFPLFPSLSPFFPLSFSFSLSFPFCSYFLPFFSSPFFRFSIPILVVRGGQSAPCWLRH